MRCGRQAHSLVIAELLDQQLAPARDLQLADRPFDGGGTGVAPLGPVGLKVVAPQDGQKPIERPVVEVELQKRGQSPQRRRTIERLARLQHDGNAQPAEHFVDQLAGILRRAEDDGDLARPRVAVDQQPLDPAGDQLDFAHLPGRGEDFDVERRLSGRGVADGCTGH